LLQGADQELAAKLEAVNKLTGKGVHASVPEFSRSW